jgi:AraC-like DNA-binding protein
MVIAWYKKSKDKLTYGSHNLAVFKWLTFLVSVISLGYIIMMFEFFLHVSWKPELVPWMTTTICIAILSICIYLLFRPEILYGFRHYVLEDSHGRKNVLAETEKDNKPAPSRNSLTRKQADEMKQAMEKHLQLNKPFLKPGYTVGDLSMETGYPSYLVSLFINQEYGKNFNELVNEYRINYLLGLLRAGSLDMDQYTLEGLGKMGGFNSRAAFISAVKRQCAKTPAQLFGRKTYWQVPEDTASLKGEG